MITFMMEKISQGHFFKKGGLGSSLAVQWLGLRAFTTMGRVQPLVRELRSHKPRGAAKK